MASIGGLISGMDTASVIRQLMQLEALPQTRLKSRVSTQERQVNALQTLNAKMAAIATKAADLTQISKWAPMKATSSSEHATVKVGTTAEPTSFTFTVDQLARAHQVSYANTVQLTDTVAPGGSVTVDFLDGTTQSIAVGDGSLDSVVKGINAAGAGLQATAVSVDGGYRLRVVSTATGGSSDFSLSGLDTNVLGTDAVTAGRDAKITIGDGAAGVQTSSSTNTFVGVASGVDVTLATNTPLASEVTVTVARDAQAMSDKVKAMVDAANLALDELKSLTAYDPVTKKSGMLAGEATLRTIRNDILSSVTTGVDGDTLATVGIQVDKAGKLVFDATKLAEAYAADPTGTAAKFTGGMSYTSDGTSTGTAELHTATWRTVPGTYSINATSTGGSIDGSPGTLSGSILTGAVGTRVEGLSVSYSGDVSGTVTYTQGFAAKLEALAQRASDSADGSITSATKRRTSTITQLNNDIENWDVRLASRRSTLERQYSALEVALGNLQNQSNWLAGQLAGLPKYSSS
jgi:flagellar hook-associated protein 2